MYIAKIFHRWNEYRVVESLTRKIHQLRYRCFGLDYKQNAQIIHRKTFLLSVLSIIIILILLFYSFGDSEKTQRVRQFRDRHLKRIKFIENDEQPIIFSKFEHLNQTRKRSENVICFLVASFAGDVRLAYDPYPKLRKKISKLDERFDDNNMTDVIVFHTGYPFRGDVTLIMEATRRQVEFVNIDHVFYRFSPGFDPHIKDPTWTQKGKWNYHHMCYFWFKLVFELKIMRQYKYMMRLDDDSQILGKWPNVFDILERNQALYLANKKDVDIEYILPGLSLVRNLTAAYIAKNGIVVRNPAMLAEVFNHSVELPIFSNNFEVVDLSLMQREDVVDFIQTIDESRGIFLYRWGDAPLRYITLALFTNATEILHRQALGLIYCHPC